MGGAATGPAFAVRGRRGNQERETITRQQADDILNELRQIRQLLERQGATAAEEPPAPITAKLNLAGMNMLGSKNAPLTMVEFTDYQCPFCQRFHTTVFNDLKKNYVDTGKLRFYSRDLPLDFHSNALRAAQAARCAADQGQFWTLRDLMGANPGQARHGKPGRVRRQPQDGRGGRSAPACKARSTRTPCRPTRWRP